MPASRRYSRRPLRRKRRIRRRTRIVRRRVTRYRRRTVSRRRILNISTDKKQDVRLLFTTLTGTTPVATPAAASAAIFTGSSASPYMCIYRPTAQDKTPSSTSIDLPNYRTQSTVYMRGYKENIRFTVNNGQTWLWRRIGFTFKSDFFDEEVVNNDERSEWEVSPNGWTRLVNNQYGKTGLYANRVLSLLFKGNEAVDWNDVFTAKTDASRVNIKYDSFKTLRNLGGNADIRTHSFNLWHPMNKTFIYNDDENGQSEQTSILSSLSNYSMGDYYIVDFFQCAQNGTASTANQLAFTPSGTLYWHEK